ncbi:MAG TPA: DUF3247 family protein [Lysobacter sp.]|nr:DUF3247 family protein [Lysobacter sp.]
MTRNANRVHTDPETIARLEALIAALPNGARVALQLDDGSQLRGIVAARPILQLFYGPGGNEGSNAVVRLEPLDDGASGVAAAPRDLWLDTITGIRDLGPR